MTEVKIHSSILKQARGVFKHKEREYKVLFLGLRHGIVVEAVPEYPSFPRGFSSKKLVPCTDDRWEEVDENLENYIEIIQDDEDLYCEKHIPEWTAEGVADTEDTRVKAAAIFERLFSRPYEGEVLLGVATLRDMKVWKPFKGISAGIVLQGGHFATGVISTSLAEF